MRYQIRHALVQYGAETIIEDVNFDIHDHEKIAIVGLNGCGKTTLLKLIAGAITMANIVGNRFIDTFNPSFTPNRNVSKISTFL